MLLVTQRSEEPHIHVCMCIRGRERGKSVLWATVCLFKIPLTNQAARGILSQQAIRKHLTRFGRKQLAKFGQKQLAKFGQKQLAKFGQICSLLSELG